MKIALPKDFVSGFVEGPARAHPILCEKLLNGIGRWGSTEVDLDTTKLVLGGELDEGLTEDRLTELMKLATKYSSSRKVPVTADVVRRLAQFKGF